MSQSSNWPNGEFNNVTIAGSSTNYGTSNHQGNETIGGTLNVTGGETVGGALSVGGAISFGAASSVVGASYTGATITGGSTGTLTNSPHSGNPTCFIEFIVNGATLCVPAYALS